MSEALSEALSEEATPSAAALAVLAKADSTMMQLTQAVNVLEKEDQPRTVKIGVSSSATVDLLNIYLRKHGQAFVCALANHKARA